jgi:hypothetical protein
MRRNDWTPFVLAVATAAVLAVAVAWVASPWLRRIAEGPPGPERARRLPPAEVETWVGDLAPGLKVVLAPVWGDPRSDEDHDLELNEAMALHGERSLSWHRLLLFNLSEEERIVPLPDGALAIRAEAAAEPILSRNLAALVERGEAKPPEGLRTVLKTLGALEDEVAMPPGSAVSLLVAFAERVELDRAVAVASADGVEFRRRRMPRGALQELIAAPDESRLKDL